MISDILRTHIRRTIDGIGHDPTLVYRQKTLSIIIIHINNSHSRWMKDL